MDKRYGKKGLRILAPEVQGSSVEDIEKVVKDNKIRYPIMKGTTRPPGNWGIPHAVVFDAAGSLVFEGHPAEPDFERSVKKALREVDQDALDAGDPVADQPAGPIIPERQWTNAEGRSITASVIAIGEDEVTFKLKNGKETPYPVGKLSDEDQTLIKEAAAKSEADEEADADEDEEE